MNVIDFRLRPPTKEYKASFASLAARIGIKMPDSWNNDSLETCVAEMDRYNIIGVVEGRKIPPPISNDHLKEIVARYPKRFIAVAGIDPTNRRECQDEITRAVEVLGFKGVACDQGLLEPPLMPNDRRLYPIYAQCEDMGIFISLRLGPLAADDINYCSPIPIDQVARDFPSLRIVITHGGWPFIDEMIAIIEKRPNVWFCPDLFQFRPGGHRYVEAVNLGGRLQERYLYGSAYPAGFGLVATLEQWKKLPWKEDILEKLLYKNATDLLRLNSLF
jgi:predicted TIM-barrel fold metal-dependent hydrolase